MCLRKSRGATSLQAACFLDVQFQVVHRAGEITRRKDVHTRLRRLHRLLLHVVCLGRLSDVHGACSVYI